MLIEVHSKLKRASKQEIFGGDLNKPGASQHIKSNALVFYRSKQTEQIEGPYYLNSSQCFIDLFYKQATGMIGTLGFDNQHAPNELSFSLVLRQAKLIDIVYCNDLLKYGKMYFIYIKNQINGPHYISNEFTLQHMQQLINKAQVYVVNEKQHFKNKQHA